MVNVPLLFDRFRFGTMGVITDTLGDVQAGIYLATMFIVGGYFVVKRHLPRPACICIIGNGLGSLYHDYLADIIPSADYPVWTRW